MNIATTTQNFEKSTALDTFVRSRLLNGLKKFNADIVAVDVFMKDINGPKGGIDKMVLIRVQMPGRHVVTIESQHENMYAAVRNGVKRARHAVSRQLRKLRRIDRQRISAFSIPALPKTP